MLVLVPALSYQAYWQVGASIGERKKERERERQTDKETRHREELLSRFDRLAIVCSLVRNSQGFYTAKSFLSFVLSLPQIQHDTDEALQAEIVS